MQKTMIILLMIAVLFCKAKAQKGEKSIAGGLLIAISDGTTSYNNRYAYSWGTGVGLEVTGQSNISNKSALLLQLQLTRFSGSSTYNPLLHNPVVTPISLKGGYKYRFSASGFYANILAGLEYGNHDLYFPVALGAGKRIPVKDTYFINAGIDFTGGFISRFNIKAIYSLLQK